MILPGDRPLRETSAIGLGELYVRSLHFSACRAMMDRFTAVLSHEERIRADRFVFGRDRYAFTACRGALRIALGARLGVRPESLTFAYGERGKPFLPRHPHVHFNVSHAADIGVIAFAVTGAVGVDVERTDRPVDFSELSSRFFSPEEAREVCSLAAPNQAQAFYNCWTRKEAYIKALGDGLSCPLDSFSVTLRPGSTAQMRWIRGDDACRWWLASFEPIQGYTASVAAPWRPARVDYRMWRLGPSHVDGLNRIERFSAESVRRQRAHEA